MEMNFRSIIKDFFSTVVIAFFLAVFINLFILQPSTVFGSSMEPTLHNGDFVIMSKLVNTFNLEPDYMDIVIIDSRVNNKHTLKDDLTFTLKYNKLANFIFQQPQERRYWIKRVIGKAGDTIEIKKGMVYRNGQLLQEDYILEQMEDTPDQKVVVPEKSVYILGDNRNNSSDSREIGCVPVENIIGKLIFKF